MSVVYPHITLIAVLVAAVAQFVLGWIWYMPSVFGNRWMTEHGIVQMPRPSPKLLLYLIGAVLTAWVVAMTYAWAGGNGLGDGLKIGAMLSIPMIATETAGGIAMARRSAQYILIQDGYSLVGFAMMGAIVAILS